MYRVLNITEYTNSYLNKKNGSERNWETQQRK